MARESGSYREGYLATIAAADAALDAFVTAIDTRLDDVGTQATKMSGSININVPCEGSGGDEFTHKVSLTFNTGTLAAGTPLTNVQTMITALNTLMTAVEGASDYTTVVKKVEVNANITAEN